MEIFDFITFQVTKIIALREERIDINTCMLPYEILHVVSKADLGGEGFGPLEVVQVLGLSQVINAETVFSFGRIHEVEGV